MDTQICKLGIFQIIRKNKEFFVKNLRNHDLPLIVLLNGTCIYKLNDFQACNTLFNNLSMLLSEIWVIPNVLIRSGPRI